MKSIKTFFILFFFSFQLFASIEDKSGEISTNVSWLKSEADTFQIIDIISIKSGGVLNIGPGVVILFGVDNKYIQITGTGRLLAIGNETDSILFTPKISKTYCGIRFVGMYESADSSILDYCIIEYSRADGTVPNIGSIGGAISIYSSESILFSKIRISHSRINNCIATDDGSSGSGGAIYCYYSSPLILNCLISYNTAKNSGGAIHCSGNSSPTIINTTFSNNYATSNYAGGIYFSNSNAIIVNSTITNNKSSSGGGLYLTNLSNIIIINCSICNNQATYGGGIYCGNTSSPTIRNSILYGNYTSNILNGRQVRLSDDGSDPNFYYCDIQGDSTEFGKGIGVTYTGVYENNINKDPKFVAPSSGYGNTYDGVNADWSLQCNSLCLNAGYNYAFLPDKDKAGNPRIYYSTVDIGAYEYQDVPCISKLNLKIFLQGAYR